MARRNGQSLRGRIAGATGSYLGNNGRHSLERGNKLASHATCTQTAAERIWTI